MTQEKQKQEPMKSGGLTRVPLGGSLRGVVETWEILKDFSRDPTCAEELGWPEWLHWF
ncbi:hypothetical protein DSLASN_36950 [Desulfoluna limicola]|uniref:Uncharacterized protein n=1 Tax=Desulfoluna limicola TaxID=2810562 RepID=A0ABN6F6U6_9BACT|nr:hypothetical protein DSLASN_36950 [Desulfoluna limicola]